MTARLPWTLVRDEDREGVYLFVEQPAGGYISVGISGVYEKSLDSSEARAMAAALLAAVEKNDAWRPPPPPTGPVYRTNGFVAGCDDGVAALSRPEV